MIPLLMLAAFLLSAWLAMIVGRRLRRSDDRYRYVWSVVAESRPGWAFYRLSWGELTQIERRYKIDKLWEWYLEGRAIVRDIEKERKDDERTADSM